jgi:hypothetical protein
MPNTASNAAAKKPVEWSWASCRATAAPVDEVEVAPVADPVEDPVADADAVVVVNEDEVLEAELDEELVVEEAPAVKLPQVALALQLSWAERSFGLSSMH